MNLLLNQVKSSDQGDNSDSSDYEPIEDDSCESESCVNEPGDESDDANVSGEDVSSAVNVCQSHNKMDDEDQSTSIEVMCTSNEGEQRKCDKHNFCPFCNIPQAKLPRHMRAIHKKEEEEKEFLNEPDK